MRWIELSTTSKNSSCSENQDSCAETPVSVFEIAGNGPGLHIHPVGQTAQIYRMSTALAGTARAEFIRVATACLSENQIRPFASRNLTPSERQIVLDWMQARRSALNDTASPDGAVEQISIAAETIRNLDALSGRDSERLLLALHFTRLQVVERLLAPRKTRMIETSFASVREMEEAARESLRAGRLQDAEDLADAALQQHPKSVELQTLRAQILAALGDLDAARDQISSSVDASPSNVVVRRVAGELAMRASDWMVARDMFGRAVELKPSVLAFRQLGRSSIELGDFEGAVTALGEALKLDPDDSPSLFLMGRAEMGRESLPSAVESFRAAVKQNPANANAWFSLGNVLIRLGDKAGAQMALSKLAEVTPHAQRLKTLERRIDLAFSLQDASESERDE